METCESHEFGNKTESLQANHSDAIMPPAAGLHTRSATILLVAVASLSHS